MRTGDIYSTDLLALTTCFGKRSGNCETLDYRNQVQWQCGGNSKVNGSHYLINQRTYAINPLTYSGYYVYRLI